MGNFFSDAAKTISTAATGGAYSTDGKSGYTQGGTGMAEFLPSDVKSAIPGIGDSEAAKKQNAQNIAAADKAMQFSERMSSTAYQRAMDDMKKAGLNPMLAITQGGASTPQGVTPTLNSESKTALGDFALRATTGVGGFSTAKQQANTQQAQAESAIKLNSATTAKQTADTAKAIADTEKVRVDTVKAKKDVPRAELEEKLSRKATDAIDGVMKSLTTTGKEQSRAGEIMGTLKNGLKFMFGPKKNSQFPSKSQSAQGGF